MKLILVDNLILPEEGSLAAMDVHPHLGLLALAAVAEGSGHEVSIYDPKRLIRAGDLTYDQGLYERVAAALLMRKPDAVGFTALGCSFLFALNVAKELKRCAPYLPILLGGPHATMLHRRIMERFDVFDVIARHECDEILPPLLAHLSSGRFEDIPGISWRVANGLKYTEGQPKVLDLDTLPLGNYDHYPIRELGLELLRIEAGRGCPFACTFCSTAGFFQRSFRLKSAGRLVSELDRLHAQYGVTEFKLDHDMFTVNRRKVLEFCEAVRGRPYRWRASARVDCVDEPLLKAMAAAGCVELYFGIETGSARMQRICAKRLDLDLVHPILAAAKANGIETTASFITGYPEELEEDQESTLDMLGRCADPNCLTQLHVLAPEPGTPLFTQHKAQMAYDGYCGPYNTDLIGTDDEALVRSEPEIFSTYYFYPAALPRSRHVFAAEAVALLRRLGPVVLRYLLRSYGGRLSALIRTWREFQCEKDEDAIPSADELLRYVRHRFGAGHHLVSLVRYALCANAGGGERRRALPVSTVPFRPDARYQLHSGVRLLSDLHDCELLLQRIGEAPKEELLDDEEFRSRGTYLVAHQGTATKTWSIDPGLGDLLELFEMPRRCSDVFQSIRASGPQLEPDAIRLFELLASEQILVPAPTAHE